MKYILSYTTPNNHYLDIEFVIPGINSKTILVNLPVWRPGRYEEGNFARNIKGFDVIDEFGNSLNYKKTQSHQWEIETNGESEIHIRYNYYCGKLDAGSCWLDEKQLYINPIHCFLYVEGWEDKPVSVELRIPRTYKVACALKLEKGNIIKAPDYHTIVDSPIIASASLQYNSYVSNGITFHLWFQGECSVDWGKVLKDFNDFTNVEIKLFGAFPAKDYHFLFQMMPSEFHHGVEHLASTVIAMGPGYALNDAMYDAFLGISCHELFHVWNVKTIRPVEMMPYRYSQRNYSRLGFVYEGITTYYGNLILFRSKGYNDVQYFKTLNDRIQKHYHNYGRFNQSVGDASFDTWMDGYVDGAPHRKTNIYTEGCLIALLLDLTIRMYTNDEKSLDDVMRKLYHEASEKDYTGYTENDIRKSVEAIAGRSYDNFFDSFVYGTEDTQPLLEEALNHIGAELSIEPSRHIYENFLGFKLDTESIKPIVKIIAPNSPAEAVGLSIGDEFIAVDGWKIENNFDELCNSHYNNGITLSFFSQNKLKTATFKETKERFYSHYAVIAQNKPNKKQLASFADWAGK